MIQNGASHLPWDQHEWVTELRCEKVDFELSANERKDDELRKSKGREFPTEDAAWEKEGEYEPIL